MSRSAFGRSLPPGVTQRMIDEAYDSEGPCAVCCEAVDDCICPECHVCGEQGNPRCYSRKQKPQHLELSYSQARNRIAARIAAMEEELREEKMWLEMWEAENMHGQDRERSIEEFPL